LALTIVCGAFGDNADLGVQELDLFAGQEVQI
jgi:hypothetical protein